MDNPSLSSSDTSSLPGSGPSDTGNQDKPSAGLGGSTYSRTNAEPSGLGTGSVGGSGGMPCHDVGQTVDRAQDAAHHSVDRLARTARDWAGRLDERAQGLTDMPARALDYSRHSVQERPMQAVLMALLVGYVMGRFNGGRHAHHGRH